MSQASSDAHAMEPPLDRSEARSDNDAATATPRAAGGAQDLALVRGALGGDREAFLELGRRLEAVPRLMAAANRRLSRPLESQDLEDAAQDALITIWRKLETFEGRSTLEGWTWAYCVFELKNRTRAAATRRYRGGASLDALPEEPAAHSPEPMPYDPDELQDALLRISPEMAEVIRLKHDESLMFKEIAARLRIPANTARTRYYRGLGQLRAILSRDPAPAKEE